MKKITIIGIGICLIFWIILSSKNKPKSFQEEFFHLNNVKACTLIESEASYQIWCNCSTTFFTVDDRNQKIYATTIDTSSYEPKLIYFDL